MGRNLSKMGETDLRGWAARIGLILNQSSDHDAAGWDFILEWPFAARAKSDTLHLTADRECGPLQCLLQVKATDRRGISWPVKLSNWLRFVKSPLPCFFLVLEYDGLEECQRAYLVPVWEEYIRRVLKRVRRLSIDNPRVALHRHTFSFAPALADELASRSGQGLDERIRAHVGSSMEDYARRKVELVKTVGYETGGKRLNARVLPPEEWMGDPNDLLIDFLLGLV
ncbi:MAG TPA: hypothetical protein VFS05_16210, partial [Gemmatimonadaceae bacterium]|nr:hypothetical protein [Gemmatimonadaceae bacterium]